MLLNPSPESRTRAACETYGLEASMGAYKHRDSRASLVQNQIHLNVYFKAISHQ